MPPEAEQYVRLESSTMQYSRNIRQEDSRERPQKIDGRVETRDMHRGVARWLASSRGGAYALCELVIGRFDWIAFNRKSVSVNCS